MCDNNMKIESYSSPLSSKGYQVNVNQRDVELPNGARVDGANLINGFYEQDIRADFLLVCGGRKNNV